MKTLLSLPNCRSSALLLLICSLLTGGLLIRCKPKPVRPDFMVSFEIDNNYCKAPCTVTLINQSKNATSYSWKLITGYDFGSGGSGKTVPRCSLLAPCPVYRTTSEQNPSNRYNEPVPLNPRTQLPLPYTVELTATSPDGRTLTISRNITIQ